MKVVSIAVAVGFLLAVGGPSTGAFGQTTRPAPASFAELIHRLGEGLVSGDSTPLSLAMADDATIDAFGERQQSPDRLVAACNGATLISFRAYAQTPSCLASDLAEDFEKARDIPETVRREMIPDSETITRANVVAAQWVMQTLDPARKHVVGVIAICPPPEHTPANVRPTPVKPVFVLIKAEMDAGKAKIRQIVFGNPLEQGK